MVKRSSKKRGHGFSLTAYQVVQEVAGQLQAEPKQSQENIEKVEGKNPHAVALGRLGGLKGGKARAEKLTAEQRLQIARKAAYTRWNKKSGYSNEQR